MSSSKKNFDNGSEDRRSLLKPFDLSTRYPFFLQEHVYVHMHLFELDLIHGLLLIQMQISWMEKFVQKGTEITAPVPMDPPGTTGLGGFEVPSSKGGTLRSDASALNVGVLHLVPTLEVFSQLADPKMYAKLYIDFAKYFIR